MVRVLMAAAAAAALLGAGGAQAAEASARPSSTTTFSVDCRTGARVTAAERAAVEALSVQMFQYLTAGRMDDAFALIAPEIQRSVGRETFQRSLAFAHENGTYNAPRVVHTYLLDVAGDPPQDTTSCEGADGLPEAYVAIHKIERQAHVAIEADADGDRWGFTSWLRFKDGRWEVYAIDVRNIGVGQKSAADIFAMAQAQRQKEHLMSAWLLYRAARTLSTRGDYYALPLQTEIEDDIRAFDATLLEEGELPVFWESGRVTYGVQDAVVASLDGKLWIQLRRWTTVWQNPRAVREENHRIVASFIKEHPDWAESFVGIELKSYHPDGKQTASSLYSGGRWEEIDNQTARPAS